MVCAIGRAVNAPSLPRNMLKRRTKSIHREAIRGGCPIQIGIRHSGSLATLKLGEKCALKAKRSQATSCVAGTNSQANGLGAVNGQADALGEQNSKRQAKYETGTFAFLETMISPDKLKTRGPPLPSW